MNVPQFARSVSARPRVVRGLRQAIVAYAERLGADAEVCESVALAVSEALNNVVLHAYVGSQPGPLHLRAWQDPDGHFVVEVTDEGHGMIPVTYRLRGR